MRAVSRAKDSDAPFNYQYEIFGNLLLVDEKGCYSENKSVTAPRLLLETKWRYFASTPEV
jgi:hypothetical protein